MQDATDEEYETPLTPDLFAEAFGYPAAMIHLAIECGLSSPGGKITATAFCRWFAAHYNDLRARAGLPLLEAPTAEMSAEERGLITIGNVLRTHADYFASRTSSWEYKEEWMSLSDTCGSLLQQAMQSIPGRGDANRRQSAAEAMLLTRIAFRLNSAPAFASNQNQESLS